MKELFFEKKSNICFIAGVIYDDILYFTYYHVGGIWKYDLKSKRARMLAWVPQNRQHEFAFQMGDEIWFFPAACSDFDGIDVFHIKDSTLKQIKIESTGTSKLKFSNYIDDGNFIWVFPAYAKYILKIEKKEKELEYIYLRDIDENIETYPSVYGNIMNHIVFLSSRDKPELLKIDLQNHTCETLKMKGTVIYSRSFIYDGALFFIPVNLNGNAVLKMDINTGDIVDEYIVYQSDQVDEFICSGGGRIGDCYFFPSYNSNFIVVWDLAREKQVEVVKIRNCQDDKKNELYYWNTVCTKNRMYFEIDQPGAPLLCVQNNEFLIENCVLDELGDGLLAIIDQL